MIDFSNARVVMKGCQVLGLVCLASISWLTIQYYYFPIENRIRERVLKSEELRNVLAERDSIMKRYEIALSELSKKIDLDGLDPGVPLLVRSEEDMANRIKYLLGKVNVGNGQFRTIQRPGDEKLLFRFSYKSGFEELCQVILRVDKLPRNVRVMNFRLTGMEGSDQCEVEADFEVDLADIELQDDKNQASELLIP
jgi:hypothetical protein